ncbi:hypothetical protein PoB_004215800 [Plakobranchus ocellatus]|uniref:Uncharacterized protein n=1 Tax=Plakobranchus ocellatus TaxID=259542 RepID=A0AAV4B7S2_9GAST|nr:hypothetical protein PoB_004215800 [Plakobranchus ocellatus]
MRLVRLWLANPVGRDWFLNSIIFCKPLASDWTSIFSRICICRYCENTVLSAALSCCVFPDHWGYGQRFYVTLSASPQQGDLRLSGPPSGQDVDGAARTATEGSLQISGLWISTLFEEDIYSWGHQ